MATAPTPRPQGPYQERPMIPEDLRRYATGYRSWPRRREYAWMAIVVALGILHAIGPEDQRASRVTQRIVEEEGARAAQRMGEVIAAQHSAGPRGSDGQRLSNPILCRGANGDQWVLQGERTARARPVPVCVNADLRRHAR